MPETPIIEPTRPKPETQPTTTPPPEREPIRRDEPTEEPQKPHRTCPLDELKLPKLD